MPPAIIMLYYLDDQDNICGPCSARQMRELMKSGIVTWESQVAEAGMDEWVDLRAYEWLLEEPQPVAVAQGLTPELVAQAVKEAHGSALASAGTKTALTGVAVGLVNPLAGIAIVAAGVGMRNAGDKMKKK